MDLTLHRSPPEADGVFGASADENGNRVMVTLEHAFLQPDGSYAPKIPAGVYTCQRSTHRLEGMTQNFITFQIMNVPNHTNCLFHWGNWNKDSDGCVLTGSERNGDMIMDSKKTWQAFMDLQKDVDSFTLTVI